MAIYQDYPLNIIPAPCGDKSFNVIDDGYLPAGTKQRGIEFFQHIKDAGYMEIVTYGTVHGYGQVATSYCCAVVGLWCTLFLEKHTPRTPMTEQAISYGANVVEVTTPPGEKYVSLLTLYKAATSHVALSPQRKFVELGLNDPEFIKSMGESISRVSVGIYPQRIWVVWGSGVLMRALAMAFPSAEFLIVQVGKSVWEDVIPKGIKYKIYKSPLPFTTDTKFLPPYPSLANYDAKIWEFACKYGHTGDYIWNVK